MPGRQAAKISFAAFAQMPFEWKDRLIHATRLSLASGSQSRGVSALVGPAIGSDSLAKEQEKTQTYPEEWGTTLVWATLGLLELSLLPVLVASPEIALLGKMVEMHNSARSTNPAAEYPRQSPLDPDSN